MKRGICITTIALYLGSLGWGLASHALEYRHDRHPAMYFVVWDMFCGWSAYSIRTHIVGEGESGRYYRLAPGPWADYHPYGDLSRHEYDSFGNHFDRLAMTTLKKTKHEPINRIYVIQEAWNKKYNFPDHLWDRIYQHPKDEHHYYHVHFAMGPDGKMTKSAQPWLAVQYSWSIPDNPRLQRDANRGKPLYAINPANRFHSTSQPGGFLGAGAPQRSAETQPDRLPFNPTPLGN